MKGSWAITAIAAFIALVVVVGVRVGVGFRETDPVLESSRIDSTQMPDDSLRTVKAPDSPTRDKGTLLPSANRSSRKEELENASAELDFQIQSERGGASAAHSASDSTEAIGLDEAMTNSVDTSAVGQPFIVSPAARPRCVEAEGGPACDRRHRIEQFTNEPRDPAWASRTEGILRSMTTERNSTFSIRNVECRLITCIIEVQSTEEIVIPEIALKPDLWRTAKIKPFGADRGDESSPTGQDIVLTLWIFQRIR